MSEHPRWPSLEERLGRIVDFCQGRALAVPMCFNGQWSMARYRTQKRLIFADSIDEYKDVQFYIEWRFNTKARSLYATNAVYRERRASLGECNMDDNVESYLGYIDIDDVVGNEQEALRIIVDCLSKLPQQGVWLLVSGTGVHVNVNGFRSHRYAQTFFDSRGIVDDRSGGVEVHMLNDVSRIGTVPYETYKKDDGVLCYPFMPWELDDVFGREDWREYYPSMVPMPWHLPPLPEVVAWNEKGTDELPGLKRAAKRDGQWRPSSKRTSLNDETLQLYVDSFDSCLPPCVREAMYSDLRDGRHRVIAFIASFMLKLGFTDAIILEKCTQRNESFDTPLEDIDLDRIVDNMIGANLEPPGCRKVNSREECTFPRLDLGDLDLCPYGADEARWCVGRSPWRRFIANVDPNRPPEKTDHDMVLDNGQEENKAKWP